ncbi:signal peptide peptidase [Chloropicon primus]|uniref:Signal peptide peptidase n=2 Tax=Chloropicon primus TaxID=1764295 RepID=A0A5B8MRF5_9CHLO|nr:signal peptide peptidase [Chloropicon primus]UPR01443.1 signal peptide peptidase [Chloropicon primus]|eukprot:QDZ22225.1 signal peptide peptidase [Chloropicon primus]
MGKRVIRTAKALLVLGAGGCVLTYAGLRAASQVATGKPNFFLDFDVDDVLVEETTDGNFLDKILAGDRKMLNLRDAIDAINEAKADKRCSSLVLRSSGQTQEGNAWLAGLASTATMQEIRAAIKNFTSEKPSVASFSTFGELGTSNGLQAYTLATACEKVTCAPTGHLSITGYATRAPFFKEFLDKWKIQLTVLQRKEYKNALNNLSESGYTRGHKEATEHLLETIFEQCVGDIANSLKVTKSEVTNAIDDGIVPASAALEAKLIHEVCHTQKVLDRAGGEKRAVSLYRYAKALRARKALDQIHAFPMKFLRGMATPDGGEEDGAVALVTLQGAILNGTSDSAHVIESTTATKLLRKIPSSMPRVKAVVLRVDSPGGSVVGSDEIWAAVSDLQEKEIPVVVSMGNVAASGGYYISAPAAKIFASPGTLTGSIGVIMAKPNFEGFLSDLGVTIDEGKKFGKNATIMSQTTSFTRTQLKALNAIIDDVYAKFVGLVAQGRGMKPEMVEKVAQGRVWTGQDAYRLGLVDQLGGIDDALRAAKELSGLREDADVLVVKQKKSFAQQAKALLSGGAGIRSTLLSILLGVDAGTLRSLENLQRVLLEGRPALLLVPGGGGLW